MLESRVEVGAWHSSMDSGALNGNTSALVH